VVTPRPEARTLRREGGGPDAAPRPPRDDRAPPRGQPRHGGGAARPGHPGGVPEPGRTRPGERVPGAHAPFQDGRGRSPPEAPGYGRPRSRSWKSGLTAPLVERSEEHT